MSATDKDVFQKKRALQFCVTMGMIPYYEVDVSNVKDLTDKPELLTDIDVLGLIQHNNRLDRVLFDCKTTKSSPINRAFWAAGLARYTDAAQCYVILKRSAPEAHRISAKSLRVHLFDEAQFLQHTQALAMRPIALDADYLVDMDRWHALHGALKLNLPIGRLGDYLRHTVPIEKDAPKVVRGILANVRQAKGELDPVRDSHLAIYFYCVAGLAVAMSSITRDIFDVFDPKQNKEAFERFLRDYIWGGREAYQLRRKLKETMASKIDASAVEFELHAWDEFIGLVRALLDSPESVFLCCAPLAGCALRTLGAAIPNCDAALKEQLSRNNRQRQFSFRLSAYLTAACGLPKEFDERFRERINTVMA